MKLIPQKNGLRVKYDNLTRHEDLISNQAIESIEEENNVPLNADEKNRQKSQLLQQKESDSARNLQTVNEVTSQ